MIAGFSVCGFVEIEDYETGVSVLILLLVSFFIAAMSLMMLNEVTLGTVSQATKSILKKIRRKWRCSV